MSKHMEVKALQALDGFACTLKRIAHCARTHKRPIRSETDKGQLLAVFGNFLASRYAVNLVIVADFLGYGLAVVQLVKLAVPKTVLVLFYL